MTASDLAVRTNGTDQQSLGLLLEALTARRQAGEVIDLEDCVREHPEHAEQLRRLVPALHLLADLGSSVGSGVEAAVGPGEEVRGTLGDFHIIREVGRGGMGIVYEAEQMSLSRRVALKVLPFAGTLDAKQLQRFKNEAQAAAHLQHGNIVPVYFVGCERGVHYYAMQFIDGQTLADLIRELRGLASRPPAQSATPARRDESPAPADAAVLTTPYPPAAVPATAPAAETASLVGLLTASTLQGREHFRAAARLGLQAAEALQHAHDLGVIHRDIKPGNLMLDGRGNLWVTDFGLAHMETEASLTMTGDLVGTLRYMSPEQTLTQRVAIDHRTDVYSLGATLYELLALQPAFRSQGRQELLRLIAFEEPRALRKIDRGIPAELEIIVLKAMAKNSAERYGTAQELADDLRHFLEDKPIKARRPTLWQCLGRWSRRHQALVRSAVVVLLLAVIALATSTVLIARAQKKTEQQRSVALANEAKANAMRRQAELDLDKALNAMRDVLGELDKEEFAEIPGIERARHELGAYILRHYQSYLDEQSADPEVRQRTARTYQSIGILHGMQGEPRKAQDALVQSVAISEVLTREFPGEARYWHRLAHNRAFLAGYLAEQGLKAQSTEEFRKMMDAFEAAAQLAPDDARVLNNLAWALAISDVPTLRDPKRAVVLARRALELAPDFGRAWGTLGVACYQAGRWSEAITDLEKSLALLPETLRLHQVTTITWFHLAMAYSRLGEDRKARSWYDKAVAWMDNNQQYNDELRRFRAEAAEVLGIKEKPATQGKEKVAQKK
jgi:serine/threonine protein kinase/Flp pilus assembly protein TadD